jgi:hypothetical protein
MKWVFLRVVAVFVIYWVLLFVALASLPGCVRTVTTCVTYDRMLQRPDPDTFVQRDSAGASVCVESGPRE